MKPQHTIDMTSGPIVKKLFLYAYPLILRSIINILYGTVDKVVAGRCLGTSAMAAIGASGIPLNMFVTLIMGLSVGVNVTCGNYIGGKKDKELRECMHTALPMGFLGGVLVCVVGLIISKPLLLVMQTPESIIQDATTYMTIRMFSYPIALFNTFTCSVMNANGDTKRPTIATLTSGFVNVVFNLLFVLGFNMDIAGLAWATFLSHATDTVILVWIMFSPKDNYKVKFSEFRLQKEHLQKILSVGFPASINSMAFTISGMLLQSSINSFGEAVVAGNTAASSCYSYVHHVLSGFCSACLCATAQCYGAHNLERIKYVVKKAISSALILCLGMATIITIFVRPLLSLFTDELAVIEAGIPIVMFNCWGFVLLTFGDMYGAALKGIRKSSLAMIISLLSVCVPRVVWVLAILPLNNTPIMLYCVYPVSWLITAIFMAIAYRKQFKQLSFATI